jgi:hypothetical protein
VAGKSYACQRGPCAGSRAGEHAGLWAGVDARPVQGGAAGGRSVVRTCRFWGLSSSYMATSRTGDHAGMSARERARAPGVLLSGGRYGERGDMRYREVTRHSYGASYGDAYSYEYRRGYCGRYCDRYMDLYCVP